MTMQTDQERLNELSQKAADYAAKKQNELTEKVASLRTQIEKLLHEREETLQLPMTPSETLAIAKKALIDGRKEIFFEELLIPHLKDVQNRHSNFLPPEGLRVHYVSERRLAEWVYGSWVTEADLIAACQELPNIGVTEVARREKIAAIDEKIKKLEGEIEKLLS